MSPLSVEKLKMLLKALAPSGERGIKIRLSILYSLFYISL